MESSGNNSKRKIHTGPNRPGRERRQKLLDAAAELVQEKPFTEISLSEIAERAGLPLSSCYHYYKDRYAVFAALDEFLVGEFARIVNFNSAPYRRLESWQQGVETYARRGRKFAERYPAMGHIWFIGKIPYAADRTAAKDVDLSQEFDAMLDRQFVLPDFPHRKEVFYIAWEIFEQVIATHWTGNVSMDTAFSEAERAMKSYLGLHLPEELPRR